MKEDEKENTRKLLWKFEEQEKEGWVIFLIREGKAILGFELERELLARNKLDCFHYVLTKKKFRQKLQDQQALLLPGTLPSLPVKFIYFEEKENFFTHNEGVWNSCVLRNSPFLEGFFQFLRNEPIPEIKNKTYVQVREEGLFFPDLKNIICKRFLQKKRISSEEEKTQTKFTLRHYQKKTSKEEEAKLWEMENRQTVLNAYEFAILYTKMNQPWLRLVVLLSYLYAYSTAELEQIEYSTIQKILQKENVRTKFGSTFTSPWVNYQQELEEQAYVHFEVNQNKYLFSSNQRVLNLQYALRIIRQELQPFTELNLLRYHAILHFYLYCGNYKAVMVVFNLSFSYLSKLSRTIFFELEDGNLNRVLLNEKESFFVKQK